MCGATRCAALQSRVGIVCTMGTCGLALAESRRDQDKDLLVNLAFGLGCFSGLFSVLQGRVKHGWLK